MAHNLEDVMKILQDIAAQMKLGKEVEKITFRKEYGDYQIILDETHHCEIREKLLDMYIAEKHADSLREIKHCLSQALPFEEWDQIDAGNREAQAEGGQDDEPLIDDTGDY